MRRDLIASLAMLAVLPLLAGCGSATIDGSAASNAVVTREQAIAYAHAVNLRQADLPTLSIVRPEREIGQRPQTVAAFARCNVTDNRAAALILRTSPDFAEQRAGGTVLYGSSVEVFRTEAAAEIKNAVDLSEIASMRFEHGLPCLLREGLATNGGRLRFGPATSSHIANPVADVPGSFAVEVRVPVFVKSRTIGRAEVKASTSVIVHVFGFRSGPAFLGLLTTGSVLLSPSTDTEPRLLSALVRRADAHKL